MVLFVNQQIFHNILLLLTLPGICVCADLYSDCVRNYDFDSFNDNVGGDTPHFVNFYAPWCGYCKRLKPIWDELAEKYNVNSPNQKIVIAKVDCTAETPLCANAGVSGYPSLMYYNTADSRGMKYEGKRDLSGLEKFITTNLRNSQGRNTMSSAQANTGTPKTQFSKELTDENFHDTIDWGFNLVKFYAPWCAHCKRLAPTWEELAEDYQQDKSVKISEVNCAIHKKSCKEFEVKGLPTIYWIVDGKKVEKYQGSRNLVELKKFIQDMKSGQIYHAPAADTSLSQIVVELTKDNFENAVSHGISFVKFFAPWCAHSRRLAPIWDDLAKKFVTNSKVKIAEIDCNVNEELCLEHKVIGYPSLLLFDHGKRIAEYSGVRKLEPLHNFISDYLLPHDEL